MSYNFASICIRFEVTSPREFGVSRLSIWRFFYSSSRKILGWVLSLWTRQKTRTVIFMSEITLVDSPLILREADSERAVSGVKIFSCFTMFQFGKRKDEMWYNLSKTTKTTTTNHKRLKSCLNKELDRYSCNVIFLLKQSWREYQPSTLLGEVFFSR